MQKTDNVTLFLAGAGIGLAASLLLAPEAGGKTRRRVRDVANRAAGGLRKRAEDIAASGNEFLDDHGLTQEEGRKTVRDIQDKAKDKAGDAADAAKSTAKQAIDKAKDVAHQVGENIEQGAQRLQDA